MFAEDRLLERYLPDWLYERLHLPHGHIRRFLRRELALLPEHNRVLDAGAGEGRYKRYMGRFAYTGLDFAKGDGSWDYGDLDVVGDVLNMPFREGSFDAAVCTQVIEHVPDPLRLLQELRRVVRPGGFILLSSPLGFGEHQVPYDFFRYTSYGLRELARRADLETVRVTPMGGFFTHLATMFLAMLALLAVRTGGTRAGKVLYLPFRLLLDVLFIGALPLLAPLLDCLVPDETHTMGHCVVYRVPEQR